MVSRSLFCSYSSVLFHWYQGNYTAPWWRHQMETFFALLAICAGNSPVLGEFPPQRPVTRSFDVYFDLRPNNRLSKQSWGWWFETTSRPLWRHRNDHEATLANMIKYITLIQYGMLMDLNTKLSKTMSTFDGINCSVVFQNICSICARKVTKCKEIFFRDVTIHDNESDINWTNRSPSNPSRIVKCLWHPWSELRTFVTANQNIYQPAALITKTLKKNSFT